MSWNLPEGIESLRLDALDVSVHYLSQGLDQEGPLLVLLHPMPLSSHMWVPVMQRLSQVVACVAPDLVGFGLTGKHSGGYGVSRQVEVMSQWLQGVAKDRPLILVGHGFGSVVLHGLVANFESQVQSVALYEGYLHPLAHPSSLGLPMEQLHYFMKHQSLHQTVVVDNFMMNQFLAMISEGGLSQEDMDIYRRPHLTEDSRRVFLDILIQMMSFSSQGEFSSVIRAGMQVYQKAAVKKVLMYSMPGLVSTLLDLDQFRHQYPSVVISEVGEGAFLAPVFCADLFTQSIKKDLLFQRSTVG
ncbi:alpha/beta fold hydrolase [Gammaproteobacteria bacterium]|nr:alpha/beta fold hydrolase [Gammaproteobacteria bacterium]